MTLTEFNGLTSAACEDVLVPVCAAPRWAAEVADGRPYASVGNLQHTAATALRDADLDPALAGHPRIGDRRAAGASAHEQAAVAHADADVQEALAEGNAAYEARFGHVYLVCASGRGADELLAILHSRLGNDPATERTVALGELAAINRLRLAALVTP